MIRLGLPADAEKALIETLAKDHLVSCTVQLLSFDHEPLGRIVGRVTAGQINYDAKTQVSRQAQITVVDPRGEIEVDYDDGQPRLNRMIRVHYNVWVDSPVWDWVKIPVFTGPITKTSRSDDGTVQIEASGKQALSTGPCEQPRSFAKGLNRVNVIRVILSELAGETRFKLPKGWPARTGKRISMGRQSSAWTYADSVARSMKAQLYYDGWGNVRLRKVPVRPSFTFRDGDGGMVISPPTVGESSEAMVNRAVVTGAIPKGKKKPLVGRATLPAWHRYSPQSMARGGRNKFYFERIEDDSLRTQKEVDDAAQRIIDRVQVAESEVTFDALPMPLLEEGDIIVVDTKGARVTAPLTQMSLPLGHDGVSTIGYLAPVSKRRR